MHVGAKKVAVAGLLAAFVVVMMVLSSVIETNTLFLIAAASFCVGIAVREWGLGLGFGFYVSCIILNFFVVPNKLYCITFAGMGLYIWLSEVLWEKIAATGKMRFRTVALWIGKYLIFNLLYVPALFFAPQLLFSGKMNGLAAILFLLLGQAAFFLYDVAYRYVQSRIWGKIRRTLLDYKGK